MHRFQDSLAGCDMPGLSINIDLDYPQPPMPTGGSSLRTPQSPLGNDFGECEYIPDPRRNASTLTNNTEEYLPTLECVEVSDAPMCDEFSLDGKSELPEYLSDPILDACMQIMEMMDKCDKSKQEPSHSDTHTPPTHHGESDHSDDKTEKPDLNPHKPDPTSNEEKDDKENKEDKDE